MMNKKALAGKALTFIVFIIIIVIMAIFVTLAVAISALNKPDQLEASSASLAKNPFLNTIEIEIDSKKNEILIFDAIHLIPKNIAIKEEIHSKLKSSLNEENNCYLLYSEFDIEKGYRIDSLNRIVPIVETEKFVSFFPIEKFKATKISFYIDGKLFEYNHYFGPCP